MTGLVLSGVAYFVVSFFVRRYLDDMGIPRSMTRALVVFVLALSAAYAVAFLADGIAARI